MKEKVKSIFVIAGVIALTVFVGFMVSRCQHEVEPTQEDPEVIVKHDTLVVRDTIPQEVKRDVIRHDTVRLALVNTIVDTLQIIVPRDSIASDSATVILPIEQSAYHGEGYDAWVSGYRAKLDSIHLSIPTTTITIKPKPKRWGVGIQAGYGITPNKPQPYIGVGVSYNLYSW